MRLDLAKEAGADNTCPVSTGIFGEKRSKRIKMKFYWRLIDEHHPVVKKLNLDPQEIEYMRNLEEQIKLRGNNILTRRAFALLAYNPTTLKISDHYYLWVGSGWSPAWPCSIVYIIVYMRLFYIPFNMLFIFNKIKE